MYQNLAVQNPMVNKFNNYMTQNPNFVPFQNNELMNNNVHVMNNLNNNVQQYRNVRKNINPKHPHSTTKVTNEDIIKKILKPEKITKKNEDVKPNFFIRQKMMDEAKNGNIGIKMTNAPYKNIIRDKIITKKVDDVKVDDLLVHKVTKIDSNIDNFNTELSTRKTENDKLDDNLKIEFHIDNYDKHKNNYFHKESYIKNLSYEEKAFDENKQDYIEFYKKKQKEAEEGQKWCDKVLRDIVDEGIISKDELPDGLH